MLDSWNTAQYWETWVTTKLQSQVVGQSYAESPGPFESSRHQADGGLYTVEKQW